MVVSSHASIDALDRSFAAVESTIANIRPEQWSWRTPCTEWAVRDVVGHLIGMNRVFGAMLADEPPLQRRDAGADDELPKQFRDSAAVLMAAFSEPEVLDRTYIGPLGSATGAERLSIRLYDLLAHGWDIAQATQQPVVVPEDVAELSLAFVREQLPDDARAGRFGPPRVAPSDATAIEHLVAYLGRTVS